MSESEYTERVVTEHSIKALWLRIKRKVTRVRTALGPKHNPAVAPRVAQKQK